MALIKAPTAAMLLLALVVVTAAAVIPSTTAAADQPATGGTAKGGIYGHGHGGHDSRDGGGQHFPLTGLTQCVTACGTKVTTCFLKCYQPLVKGDPVELPLCLFNCTTTAMICGSSCSADIV